MMDNNIFKHYTCLHVRSVNFIICVSSTASKKIKIGEKKHSLMYLEKSDALSFSLIKVNSTSAVTKINSQGII